jgi:hypothetical protein
MNTFRTFSGRSSAILLSVTTWWAASISAISVKAGDPFAEGVRPTPWKTPADQQRAFKVPPGFEVQLVAAEPDINKPMNLAFDAKGRLWVTG